MVHTSSAKIFFQRFIFHTNQKIQERNQVLNKLGEEGYYMYDWQLLPFRYFTLIFMLPLMILTDAVYDDDDDASMHTEQQKNHIIS